MRANEKLAEAAGGKTGGTSGSPSRAQEMAAQPGGPTPAIRDAAAASIVGGQGRVSRGIEEQDGGEDRRRDDGGPPRSKVVAWSHRPGAAHQEYEGARDRKADGPPVDGPSDTLQDVSRGASPKFKSPRKGAAGSAVVRGLCENVTEAAILRLFGEAAGASAGLEHGVTSVRLLPLNRRSASRARLASVPFVAARRIRGVSHEFGRRGISSASAGIGLGLSAQVGVCLLLTTSRPCACPPAPGILRGSPM